MRVICVILISLLAVNYSFSQKGFSFIDRPDHKKIDLLYDGKLLTSYCYFDSTEKPVLFPIKTVNGVTITRGYPIAPRPGERTDHPHHVGLWLNYESVNGLDFWNNSSSIAPEKKHLYGSIRHQKVLSKAVNKKTASLKTLSLWQDYQGNNLLEEETSFVFSVKGSDFIIERSSKLVAKADEVVFKDIKDGMLGLRVARQLELPSANQKDKYVDAQGNVTVMQQMSTEGVTGNYVNSNGVKGDAAWGKRANWTYLTGIIDGKQITITIFDHIKNVGYPTYWHARGYGLFAVNPLGQKVFSEGKEELNFTLKKDQASTFSYSIVIREGSIPESKELDKMQKEFSK